MNLSARPLRTRLLIFACSALLFVVLFGALGSTALAQEGGGEQTSSESAPQEKGLFLHMVESVGLAFGLVLGFVSVALIALIVLLAMDLRMGAAIPPGFVEDFTDVVNKRKFKEAYEMARTDSSFLGRVMTAGMGRLQYGIEDAREAAFNTVETIRAGKDQLNAYLATIGTLGPLLGLVGTVWGMIGAFRVIANSNRIDPKALAGQISHALVVTLLGVALSVPAIFFHTFYRNRLTRLAMDTGNVADDLLTQMYHNSKKSAPAPAPAPAPVAVAAVNQAAGAPGAIKS